MCAFVQIIFCALCLMSKRVLIFGPSLLQNQEWSLLDDTDPRRTQKTIASNNWDQYGDYMEEEGKVECAIKLWIPRDRLVKAKAGPRDIWVHRGHVHLGNYTVIYILSARNIKMEVYYYTSKDSLATIRRTGYIRESPLSVHDAFYRAGVYLTTLTPEERPRRIASNNWGQYGDYMEVDGKVKCAIKLWIPRDRLVKAKAGPRDIWVHRGHVHLGDYSYSVIYMQI